MKMKQIMGWIRKVKNWIRSNFSIGIDSSSVYHAYKLKAAWWYSSVPEERKEIEKQLKSMGYHYVWGAWYSPDEIYTVGGPPIEEAFDRLDIAIGGHRNIDDGVHIIYKHNNNKISVYLSRDEYDAYRENGEVPLVIKQEVDLYLNQKEQWSEWKRDALRRAKKLPVGMKDSQKDFDSLWKSLTPK